jgi:hypothetical protein
MAFQGEYFVDRYGAAAAKRTPPIRRMLDMGVPVGAGTDATRVANYNPFNSLYWLVSGKTLGGLPLYDESNRMTREDALRLYTQGSSWFSGETDTKGTLAPGQLADLAVLSSDYFEVPEEEIRGLHSVLTMVGGKVVYAAGELASHDPGLPPAMPDWSPIRHFGGYGAPRWEPSPIHHHACGCKPFLPRMRRDSSAPGLFKLWGSGCDCFAF